MAKSQFRSRKKVSGKKYISFRKERASDMAGLPALTLIGQSRLKIKRVMCGNTKKSLLKVQEVCVNDGAKTKKLAIESVVNNPANINYTRRNVITKGCIVKTAEGDVRITSRPGQAGTMFGVFIK